MKLRPIRIAQVAPPMEPVPPRAYGGTERIVHELVVGLTRRGHDVTTFASGDSTVPGRLVPTVPKALRPSGDGSDPDPWFLATIDAVMDRAHEFDLIHLHLEWFNPLAARILPVPIVATFHGRLDLPFAPALLSTASRGLVAISRSQASAHPRVPWTIIHNGLDLESMPFDRRRGDDLCFVGRIAPEKGILEAMEIARRTGRRLRIAAKVGTQPRERDYHENVFLPALRAAGSSAEFLGELEQRDRDRLFAQSYALVMVGSWPEPFGLVAIESLACGTPILARRIGALPEIMREGIDGFFGDDVDHLAFLVPRLAELDPEAIRASVVARFSGARMTSDYEALYANLLGENVAEQRPPIAQPGLVPSVTGLRFEPASTDRTWPVRRPILANVTRPDRRSILEQAALDPDAPISPADKARGDLAVPDAPAPTRPMSAAPVEGAADVTSGVRAKG